MTTDARAVQLLVEKTPALLWTTDAALRVRSVTGAPELRHDDFAGRSVAEIVDDGPAASAAILAHHRALEGEEATFDTYVARRALQCHVAPLRDGGGSVVGVVGVGLDVTKQLEAQARLSGAEATYKALVEQIPAAVYIDAVDERSTALYSSPQVEAMLGYSPSEWTSDPDLWVKLLHPEDRPRVLAASMRSNRSGEPFSEEYRLMARDGRVVWVRDEAVMVRDPDGRPRCWQGVMFDVTEQKRTEENLERSIRMLRAADQERRRLLTDLVQAQEDERARIASEIHDDSLQVLLALAMRLEMLEERVADQAGRDELRQAQATLELCVDRMRNLLFEVHPPVLDHEGLTAALRVWIASMRVEADLPCSLENHLNREPPAEVGTILYRVAVEALNNVRKHARATQAIVTLEERDGGVLLRVTDDGAGFSEDDVAARLPGHVGLASMRQRAAVAGGWFRIESTPGQGTSVEVWVPVAGSAQSLAS